MARNPWTMAVVLSLISHVAFYGFFHYGKGMRLPGQEKLLSLLVPKASKHPVPLLDVYKLLGKLAKPKPKPEPKPLVPQMMREPPMVFISVDPSQAEPEPPKDAKFYSDKNSLAANPVIKKPSDIPNVDGAQTHVPQTMDVPRQKPQPQPLQPVLPKPPPEPKVEKKPPEPTPVEPPKKEAPPKPMQESKQEPKPELKPKGGDTPGDLALVRPSDTKRLDEGTADKKVESTPPKQSGETSPQPLPRPRTLVEARMRQQTPQIAGRKMLQEGGVPRTRLDSSLDARATPFGAYDAAVVAAIQQRWYDLLDQRKFARDRRGYVVLDFRLYSDGSVRNLEERDNTVDVILGTICQRSISDVQPFGEWPADMKRMVGADYREVRFTFYYE
jgi:outer membrane biosynthesis protein TonB